MEDSDTEGYDREMVYLGDHPCVRWCGLNSESWKETPRQQDYKTTTVKLVPVLLNGQDVFSVEYRTLGSKPALQRILKVLFIQQNELLLKMINVAIEKSQNYLIRFFQTT